MYAQHSVDSEYIRTIRNILNELGLSGFWIQQDNLQFSLNWFKEKVKRCLYDQYIQQWFSDIDTKDVYWNYRMYKYEFVCEKYINVLSYNQCILFMRFRTLNNNLPVQTERYSNILKSERRCLKRNTGDLGDEYHYVLICDFFKDERSQLIAPYYWKTPNAIKYNKLFCNTNKRTLGKLIRFIQIINKNFVTGS